MPPVPFGQRLMGTWRWLVGKIRTALSLIFLLLCLFCLIFSLAAARDPYDSMELLGHRLFLVTSSSMERCEATDVSEFSVGSLPLHSLILVKSVPQSEQAAKDFYDELAVGDVLTFRYVYTTQVTITHRITDMEEKESGGYLITLAGDNKSAEGGQLTQTIDTSLPLSPNYVIGRVLFRIPLLGSFLFLLETKIGKLLCIILPATILLIMELFRLVWAYTERSRQKAAEAQKELVALRAELAKRDSTEPDKESGDAAPLSHRHEEEPQ